MSKVKQLLSELSVRPSKGKGQNFLLSSHDAERLVCSCGISTNDTVLEIGPGLGALTEFINQKANKIICIEIENGFSDFIRNTYPNIEVINSDFRDIILSNIFNDKIVLISNLPYVFSSEAIIWLVQNRALIKSASLLVQREFAERIAAAPGTKEYGSITVHTQYYYDIDLGAKISGDAFYPKANVPSQQIHLKPKSNLTKLDAPDEFFEKVVRASFSMRRKKIVNCLISRFENLTKDSVENILSDMCLKLDTRAECLTVDEFCYLANRIYSLL